MPKFPLPALLRKSKPRLLAVADPGHLGFDYTIRLSARKSAAIEVRAGKVLVAAPLRASPTELQQWVTAKAGWIRDKLEQQSERHQQIPQRQFQDGEVWSWLDETLTLRLASGTRSGCQRRGAELWVSLSKRTLTGGNTAAAVARNLQAWYQAHAQTLLEHKTAAVCQQLQIRYPQASCQRVQLRRTRSKWGHCTRQGVIQYNWLITQAPEWVVDYLVVHECCHLVHHNHSATFWGLVASLCPQYAAARQWLRQNGHTLVL